MYHLNSLYFTERVKIEETEFDIQGETNDDFKNGKIKTSAGNTDGPGLLFRRKLYMERKTNIVLNINAVILIAVFVFLYAYFA